jgi:uncharacterized protein YcaQ
VEEDTFVNYGFVPRSLHVVMHPRTQRMRLAVPRTARERAVVEFVKQRGAVHPREVDEHFAHGTVTNYWGGSSSATTHLLEHLHYRGLLRVVRREAGIRVYTVHEHAQQPGDAAARRAQLDRLVDAAVHTYAPLPDASLSFLVRRLRYAAPHLRSDLTAALVRARQRLSHARAGDVIWYWPAGERLARSAPRDEVRLLAPFDPVVWDRRRFELFWGWAYRFEAYTPSAKRTLGYYAQPLLWRDRIVGWGNVAAANGKLRDDIGYVAGEPDDEGFKSALEAELDRFRVFLGLVNAPAGIA